MGYLTGATGGALNGAAAGAPLGPWGAGAGAVAGGLLGAFGSGSAPDTGLTDGQRHRVDQYYKDAEGYLTGIAGDTAGGLHTLREAASEDPSQLRSYQQTGLADATRGAQARLNAAGMANSGRGGVLAATEGVERARQGYEAQNRGEQMGAAGQLAGYNVNARTGQVGLKGQEVANVYRQRALKTTGQMLGFEQGQQQSQDAMNGLGNLGGAIYSATQPHYGASGYGGYSAGGLNPALTGYGEPSSGMSGSDRFKYWATGSRPDRAGTRGYDGNMVGGA